MTDLTPSEVDTIYLKRLAAYHRAADALSYATDRVLRESGDVVRVQYSSRSWHSHIVRKGTALPSYPVYADVQPHLLTVQECVDGRLATADSLDTLARATVVCQEAQSACREVDAEYNRRPWSRYWLVTSSDGHIHRSCHCSTCNKGLRRTGFALTPFLSGTSDAVAVADLGPALCSVCFPDAPVDSREQARIPARLALALAEEGVEAFQKARQEASAKKAARCPGSGQQGVPSAHRAFHKCPVCGESQRATAGGKFRPHKPAQFYIENNDWKCWSGSTWGPRTKAAIYGSFDEAEATAAKLSEAGSPCKTRRK